MLADLTWVGRSELVGGVLRDGNERPATDLALLFCDPFREIYCLMPPDPSHYRIVRVLT